MSTASDVAALDAKINELGRKHEAMAEHVIKLTELLMSLVDAARLFEKEDAAKDTPTIEIVKYTPLVKTAK